MAGLSPRARGNRTADSVRPSRSARSTRRRPPCSQSSAEARRTGRDAAKQPSERLRARLYADSRIPPGTLLTLLVIADHVHGPDPTLRTSLRVPTIARWSHQSDWAIRRHLDVAERLGIIAKVQRRTWLDIVFLTSWVARFVPQQGPPTDVLTIGTLLHERPRPTFPLFDAVSALEEALQIWRWRRRYVAAESVDPHLPRSAVQLKRQSQAHRCS